MIKIFPITIIKQNLEMALKVVWVRFMRLKELTYIAVDKNASLFKDLYLIRSDITFLKKNQYTMLKFKCSKIDTNYIRVFIMLTIIKNSTWPVIAFCSFFIYNF